MYGLQAGGRLLDQVHGLGQRQGPPCSHNVGQQLTLQSLDDDIGEAVRSLVHAEDGGHVGMVDLVRSTELLEQAGESVGVPRRRLGLLLGAQEHERDLDAGHHVLGTVHRPCARLANLLEYPETAVQGTT